VEGPIAIPVTSVFKYGLLKSHPWQFGAGSSSLGVAVADGIWTNPCTRYCNDPGGWELLRPKPLNCVPGWTAYAGLARSEPPMLSGVDGLSVIVAHLRLLGADEKLIYLDIQFAGDWTSKGC